MFQFKDDDDDDNILDLLGPPTTHSIKADIKTKRGRSDVTKNSVSFSADVASEQHRYPQNKDGGRNDRASLTSSSPPSSSSFQTIDGGTHGKKSGIASDKNNIAVTRSRGISSSPRNKSNVNENRQQQQQMPYAEKKKLVADPLSFSRTKGAKSNTFIDIDDLLRMDDDDDEDASITDNEEEEEEGHNLNMDSETTSSFHKVEYKSRDNDDHRQRAFPSKNTILPRESTARNQEDNSYQKVDRTATGTIVSSAHNTDEKYEKKHPQQQATIHNAMIPANDIGKYSRTQKKRTLSDTSQEGIASHHREIDSNLRHRQNANGEINKLVAGPATFASTPLKQTQLTDSDVNLRKKEDDLIHRLKSEIDVLRKDIVQNKSDLIEEQSKRERETKKLREGTELALKEKASLIESHQLALDDIRTQRDNDTSQMLESIVSNVQNSAGTLHLLEGKMGNVKQWFDENQKERGESLSQMEQHTLQIKESTSSEVKCLEGSVRTMEDIISQFREQCLNEGIRLKDEEIRLDNLQVSLSNNQQTSIEKQDEEYQKLSAQKDDFLNEKRLSEKDLSQKRAELEREYLFFKEEQQSFIKQRENFKIEEAKNLNWLRSEEDRIRRFDEKLIHASNELKEKRELIEYQVEECESTRRKTAALAEKWDEERNRIHSMAVYLSQLSETVADKSRDADTKIAEAERLKTIVDHTKKEIIVGQAKLEIDRCSLEGNVEEIKKAKMAIVRQRVSYLRAKCR